MFEVKWDFEPKMNILGLTTKSIKNEDRTNILRTRLQS